MGTTKVCKMNKQIMAYMSNKVFFTNKKKNISFPKISNDMRKISKGFLMKRTRYESYSIYSEFTYVKFKNR